MNEILIKGAETVSMFCRLNMNTRRDLPIRSSEMGLLILLCKSEKKISPVMAADYFEVKKPMITAMVASLSGQGYVEKIPSPEDKRSFFLMPTEKARTLVDDTLAEYIKTLETLRQKLGEVDFTKLITLLETANAILLEEKNNG